ncbi:MAG TPA: pyridoxal-phosphate dependent enzyme [Ferruginibacter sp.]|jgi:1-aminocyclopropane-1-carboxylate deaminase|nr:pyridoxal-phosphate dependent enzyme [Ferruginibacter sp.]
MLFDNSNIKVDTIKSQLLDQLGIELSVLRLDLIHPIISGNKLFKLFYFLQDAEKFPQRTIITFGGAYSNHLVATAYACKLAGLKSVGIVRGEKPSKLSHSLQNCLEYGMELKFISRQAYDQKEETDFQQNLLQKFDNAVILPEGGYDPNGAKGASLIMNYINEDTTHICCALGTATTVAGLLSAVKAHQHIVAVPVLKGLHDIDERISFLLDNKGFQALQVLHGYHFGGYAKYTSALLSFMNELYEQHQLPTDFVYTAKMFFAVFDSIKKQQFPKGSKIVCLHTGGLQGNLSLPVNSLFF